MTAPGSGSLKTADQMRARLAQLAATPSVEPPLADPVRKWRRDLRERVVLLDFFAAADLPTRWWGSAAEVQEFVAADCELVTLAAATGWRLRLEVRRATLARLGRRGALAASNARRAVPADSNDITHRMALLLLQGNTDLDQLSPGELSGILRAREWLVELDLALPAESDVQRALDMANVLDPLRAVARPDFIGRSDELAVLKAYVDRPADGPEPLAINGPGGVGKSALVSRFVLDHVDRRAQGLVFAYLTFDRAELDPQYPLTLVREIARQVALQDPAVTQFANDIVVDVNRQLAADIALRQEQSSSRGYGTRDANRNFSDVSYFVSQLHDLVGGHARLLLVLDTFEVAQRRRRTSLAILRSFLDELRSRIPSTRIVVAGRAEARELTSEANQHALRGLDATQARGLLRRAVGTLEVSDDLVAEVAGRVSGNPLNLRLAAELMRSEGAAALSSGRGRRKFLSGLREEQVQGILYRRILDHIDAKVRPLASPGLVVRRITPEVIAEVLAKPCGLGKVSPDRAFELFYLLRQEVSLVTEISPEVLVHRADVRREMLPLLVADDPERVEEIHRRAVKYYGKHTGIDDRTEQLYHRLMLGQSTDTIDGHWDPIAGAALETVIKEFPASSRVYLADHLKDVEADPADLADADESAWVRQVTRQARRLLDAGQAAEALELLASRDGSDQIPVVSVLRIEALASLHRRDEALAAARHAMAAADSDGLLNDYVELAIVAGRVAEDAGDLESAGKYFRRAREGAEDLGARIAGLSSGAGVLRIARRNGGTPTNSRTTSLRRVQRELVAEASTLTEREKSRNPALLRELAAELGDEVPGLLADAAAHLGVDTASKAPDQLSEQVRTVIDETATKHLRPTSAPPSVPSYFDMPRPPIRSVGREESGSSSDIGRAVADALNEAPDDAYLRESVKEYWQSEADLPSYDYFEEPGSAT